MLQVQKAAILRAKSGDATSLRLALEGLPTTMANDIGALCAARGGQWVSLLSAPSEVIRGGNDALANAEVSRIVPGLA